MSQRPPTSPRADALLPYTTLFRARGDRIRSGHMYGALAKLAPVHVAALADNEADAALARDKMAPLCKSLAIEVRKASRPLALARAVLTGDPVSNRLFRSAALARQDRTSVV